MKIKIPVSFLFYARSTCAFFLIQFLTRIILIAKSNTSYVAKGEILFTGLFWDLSAWTFLGLPIVLASAFFSPMQGQKIANSIFSKLILGVVISTLSFVAFCELTFWEEFRSRFNFIAVDYLIYTNEVVANINESFPMPIILSGIIIFSSLLTFIIFRIRISNPINPLFKKAHIVFFIAGALPLLVSNGVLPFMESLEPNFRKDQLARNGWIEFFRAFRSNQIDYRNFYLTIGPEKAKSIVLSGKSSPENKTKILTSRPDVVIIVVESLGAKFIAPLGGQETTTPFLNQLAQRSIFFENLYATGTRTVRGLEAINLSLPPTPGYAVVKRPEHKNLYSLGNTFRNNGYDPIFLYGGRGFFDNMNSFFEGNGFRTIDQSDFTENEVTFSNAWGVCDEDLFSKALRVMDTKSKIAPRLLFILTTSNHRPFTYPGGKIDIPSGESRAGAVKYTDFAIGKFIQQSLNKAWSKNTIFLIVADHSTEGRGRFDLEMADYHIPMWIFAPALLSPRRISRLVSQIDILPSLIGLLGLEDDSPFFGENIFSKQHSIERAFIGNYQYVGFYKEKILTTLGPNRKVRSYSYDPTLKKQKNMKSSPFVNEAISYYQYASDLLSTGQYSSIQKKNLKK